MIRINDAFAQPWHEGGYQAGRPHHEQHQHHPVEQLLQKIVEASALYSKCEINVNTQRHYHLISISHDWGAPNLDLPARS